MLVRWNGLAGQDGHEDERLFLGDNGRGRGTKLGGNDSECTRVTRAVVRPRGSKRWSKSPHYSRSGSSIPNACRAALET